MTRMVKVEDSRFLSGITEIPTLKIGKYEFVFETELSEKARAVAERELRETTERRTEALAELKRLLTEDQDLKWPNNDFFLIRFLRKCKFYPESASVLIKKYFDIKAKYPQYFYNFNIDYYLEIVNMQMLHLMPKRDHKGRRIAICRVSKQFNPDSYSLDELFKGVSAMMEVASSEPDTQVNGVVGILDLEDLSLSHIKPLTPSFIRFGIKWGQDCIPLRLKALHIVNETTIIDATYAIIKNFLSEKLRSRIYFHGKDYKSLHEYVAPSCLMTRYGGNVEFEELPKAEEILSQHADFASSCLKELEMLHSYGYKKDITENTQL
ncbi:CRAL-TRIO domain-containing protein [Sergentomyia squamirostris]